MSQDDLFIPVKNGFDSDNDHHRRNNKAIENFLRSPHISNAHIRNLEVDEAMIADLAVTTAKIDDLAVTTAKIDDLAVTNAKITSLVADKITAGEIAVTLLVSGLIQSPAATGFRVEIGNATFPLRYWDGATTNFRVDAAGNVLLSGELQNAAGDPIIRQTGYPRAKVAQTNTQTFTTTIEGTLNWASATNIQDSDTFIDTANDQFVMPFDGQYLVIFSARWEANADSTARRIRAYTASGGSVIDELTSSVRAHAEAFPTTSACTAVVDFTAGDNLRFAGTQYSGGDLDIVDWSAQILFLGDT
jgi:hypothetical protein